MFDHLDLQGLSVEEGVVKLEAHLKSEYGHQYKIDRETNIDYNGNYCGDYVPEREYVAGMLAILDAYDIGNDISDITDLSGEEFKENFLKFRMKIQRLCTKFSLNKLNINEQGIKIIINSNYKEDISKYLEKIRKIVNQEIKDIHKKDSIFICINNLQEQVDRDINSLEKFYYRVIQLSKIISECAGNLKAVTDTLKNIKDIALNNELISFLPNKERVKLITQEKKQEKFSNELHDNIPF